MAEVVPFKSGGGSSGPEDPMLEQRVAKLEEGLGRIELRLASIESELKHIPKAADYGALRADVAEIKGRLANMPTTLQLIVMLITTWSVGAGLVFALLRFSAR
jgi:hypothetical protein